MTDVKFAKLENGTLVHAPMTMAVNGRVHYHPTEELYRRHGFKPVVYAQRPADGKYYQSHWEDGEDALVQVWQEEELPEAPVYLPTIEERLTLVEGIQAQLQKELTAAMQIWNRLADLPLHDNVTA